ncbi:zf-HC2 domain-containing protein [Candidatus Poribacteria bacterium]|nr:zf-HC2 domain-containing protein [Candidatus Poribacteria bacterium]
MKPQCRSIQRCLSDYIDYTLSARQTIIVAQHLRFCRDCQLELKSLRRTEVLLRVHVPPQPPEGYYDQFGEQVQQLIEKQPRPVWWGATALAQLIAWRFQEFLHQLTSSFSKLISFPIGWVKHSPAYVWMLLIILISLSAYQSFQPQEPDRSGTVNLSQVVKVQPTSPLKESGNREVISNRERLVATTQTLPENVVQSSQNIDKEIESLTELSRWEGHQPDPVSDSNFVNDSYTFKAMAIDDASPDLVAIAQLSSPEPIAAKENFSQPLGVVAIPTSAEIGWSDNPSLNGVVEMLMNVPLPSFSITEVYDSVKL